jgi:hypothetical protein
MDRFEVMLEPLRVFLTQIADFLPLPRWNWSSRPRANR